MKLRLLLLILFLLTSLCAADMTLDELTSLFHQGEYERLVIEGEILGERFQSEKNTDGVARVYQMLTIAYMRLGRKDDMMRVNAISKGAFAEDNGKSADPEKQERAILDQASALFSSGDMDKTVSFVREKLKTWPNGSINKFYLLKPKFLAISVAKGQKAALDDLEQELSVLQGLLTDDSKNRAAHLAVIGLTNLMASEATMFSDLAQSQVYGKAAREQLELSGVVDINSLPGGPNLPFRIAAAAGEYRAALQRHREYEKTFPARDIIYRFTIESRKAFWLEQMGRKAEAFEKYNAAIRTIDIAWSELRLRENKTSLMSGFLLGTNFMTPGAAFKRAIALALDLGEVERAFELSELFKSRSLRDALSREVLEEVEPDNVSETLLQREKMLYRQLAKKSTAETLKEYLQVLEQIRLANKEYYFLLSGNPGAIQRPELNSDEILVEYFLTDSEALIFVLNGKNVSCTRKLVSPESLEKQVRSVRRAITRVGSEKSLKKKLRALSDQMIAPVESQFDGKKRVIFVPHGKLHYLPFASLLKSDNTYLVESFEVNVAPSAQSLSFSQRKNPRRKGSFKPDEAESSVFALGALQVGSWVSLPGTQEESARVKSSLPKSQVLLGGQMTRAKVLQGMSTAPILHFATHGYFNKDEPLKSGLVAADGDITVADVLQHRINGYSVFLSACETAVGQQAGADEIVGMQQSFQFAGSPSVIATLWQISDDATAELVSRYYRDLKTKPKGQALREAQLAMLSGEYRHPYFWAAFVLSGDWI